jgi:hypothetical protein
MRTSQFITRTFFNIYPDFEKFELDAPEFMNTMSEEELKELFMLIAARYGDSHTRYTNEFLFKMNLWKDINNRYPMVIAWKRDQKRLRDADLLDFQRGGKTVQNAGAHNTANISTDTMEGIEQLDAQTITNNQRGELGVLLDRLGAYATGQEDKFLIHLAKLFMQVIAPMADLLFGTEGDEQ